MYYFPSIFCFTKHSDSFISFKVALPLCLIIFHIFLCINVRIRFFVCVLFAIHIIRTESAFWKLNEPINRSAIGLNLKYHSFVDAINHGKTNCNRVCVFVCFYPFFISNKKSLHNRGCVACVCVCLTREFMDNFAL